MTEHFAVPAAAPAPRPLALPSLYAGDTVVQAFAGGVGAALAPAEGLLDRLDQVFDPWVSPSGCLDWLARITGARIEADWDEIQHRTAIALAPWLEPRRGTRQALLREAEEIYGWTLKVEDPGGVFTGAGTPPDAAAVIVTLTAGTPETQTALTARLTRLVQAHCPAHVPFRTEVVVPS
ncbi:phage tail protein [Streptomyces sp. NPDC048161]|uniref:phage tail protein n=1 Tax=Streptomyces sp. NPDC048161 TaxID=3160985 RepID=UPI00340E0244